MSEADGETVVAPAATPAAHPAFLNWLVEGTRTLLFMRPRWARVHATPGVLAWLVILHLTIGIGITRLYVDGPATFQWRAGLAGWSSFLLAAWACYAVRPRPQFSASEQPAPDAAHLLAMQVALSLVIGLVYGLVWLLLSRAGLLTDAAAWVAWALWLMPAAWATLAELALLMRSGERALPGRMQAVAAIVVATALSYYFAPHPQYWYAPPKPEAAEPEPIHFTQDVVELQGQLMDEQVNALKPQRPGIIDMYTLTFAPYEGEDVFLRESRMVNEVMARRFDSGGRGLQLINHRDHVEDMLWATPLNMERAILGIADKMDKEEDVLFIHLTSHGARDGELAANFWPLDAEPITPEDLRKLLDDAGIKHRVISISACFSGSWIAPLASEDTLVMTAADANHTSYGCGHKSPLTFFGRAMYDEQLRNNTLSFEQAHAAARKVIDQREKAAGKDDGYSNPQIKVGSAIRPYLEKMNARLQTRQN